MYFSHGEEPTWIIDHASVMVSFILRLTFSLMLSNFIGGGDYSYLIRVWVGQGVTFADHDWCALNKLSRIMLIVGVPLMDSAFSLWSWTR